MPKRTKPPTDVEVKPQSVIQDELAPEIQAVQQPEAQMESLVETEAPAQPMGNIRGD